MEDELRRGNSSKGRMNEMWGIIGQLTALKTREGMETGGEGKEWAVVDEEGLRRLSRVRILPGPWSCYWGLSLTRHPSDPHRTTARACTSDPDPTGWVKRPVCYPHAATTWWPNIVLVLKCCLARLDLHLNLTLRLFPKLPIENRINSMKKRHNTSKHQVGLSNWLCNDRIKYARPIPQGRPCMRRTSLSWSQNSTHLLELELMLNNGSLISEE